MMRGASHPGGPAVPVGEDANALFGRFVRAQVEQLVELLWSWMLPAAPLGAVLDLDSTVFERYGHQEGSLKGHNPGKHGRPSHHPLLAFLAEAKVVLHAWLRSGNTSARGVRAFLDEALAHLPQRYPLYAVRAAAGFFDAAVLGDLEHRQLPYAIAVRLTVPLKRRRAGLQTWQELGPGLEVGSSSTRRTVGSSRGASWSYANGWPSVRRPAAASCSTCPGIRFMRWCPPARCPPSRSGAS